jgi:hypothetical protein
VTNKSNYHVKTIKFSRLYAFTQPLGMCNEKSNKPRMVLPSMY